MLSCVCAYVYEYAFRLPVRPVWMTCLSNVRAELWIAAGRDGKGGRILTQLPAFCCFDLEDAACSQASSLPVWERAALGYSHFHYVLNWADFLPWTRCTHARTHTWIYMHAHTHIVSPALLFTVINLVHIGERNRGFQANTVWHFKFTLSSIFIYSICCFHKIGPKLMTGYINCLLQSRPFSLGLWSLGYTFTNTGFVWH